MVRNRAANPASFVDPEVKYVISPYPAFASATEATAALRFERKLELALEGQRFFDLVRWGVADKEINEYFAYEIPKLGLQFSGSRFQAGKHEYLPIPQRQIDLQSTDVLKQNPGY
jgi:hypothetical protein